MPHPILSKLELTYVSGSAWTPADFNRFTRQSQRIQDFFCGPHDTDGYHTNDELIPKEAVIATYAAGVYTRAAYSAGISAITRASAGRGGIQFDPDFPATMIPMLAVFPVVSSSERVYAFQDDTGTNDETELTFAMFDDTGAFVDRDFIAVIFAPRR